MSKIYERKIYFREGKPAIYDPYREILVPDTPEERIRQQICEKLEQEYKFPKYAIKTEFPLSRIDKKSRDRADIVVWALNKAKEETPLLVIEVKSRDFLTDDVREQVKRYQNILKCPYFAMANESEWGKSEWRIFMVKGDDNKELELKSMPTYKDMINESNLEFLDEQYDECKQLKQLSSNFYETNQSDQSEYINFLKNEEVGVIGLDTPKKFYHIIVELEKFLLAGKITESFPIKTSRMQITEDLGVSFRSYGNAAGGQWPGCYRSFMIKDLNNEDQIYRIAILGKGKFVNDPKFGNTNSTTTLIIAVDNFDKSHNSLQMNLDKSLFENNGYWEIIHDGKMTVGNKGAVSQKKVFDYIKKKFPESVFLKHGLFLGKLPKDKSLDWNNSGNFIKNLLDYANLRDELRKELEKQSMMNTTIDKFFDNMSENTSK